MSILDLFKRAEKKSKSLMGHPYYGLRKLTDEMKQKISERKKKYWAELRKKKEEEKNK